MSGTLLWLNIRIDVWDPFPEMNWSGGIVWASRYFKIPPVVLMYSQPVLRKISVLERLKKKKKLQKSSYKDRIYGYEEIDNCQQ